MLTIIGTLLTSIVSGGATGLLGMLFQRYFDYKNKQQDIAIIKLNLTNAVDLKKIDQEIAAKNAEAQISVAAREAAAKVEAAIQERIGEEARADALVQEASYDSDQVKYLSADVLKSQSRVVRWSMAIVDFTRGMLRPILTVYLVALTNIMYVDMQGVLEAHGATMTAAEAQVLVAQVVSTILYLATTAVVWWFGTRPPKKSGDK